MNHACIKSLEVGTNFVNKGNRVALYFQNIRVSELLFYYYNQLLQDNRANPFNYVIFCLIITRAY